MRMKPDGTPEPYLTKIELLDAWEAALAAVSQAETIEQARAIVLSAPSRGGRWRKASPLSHAELMKAAEELDGKA